MRELRGSSSQREMAEAIGIKWNAWARYEAGGALPGADILERICRIHACSADWLLGLPERGTTATVTNSPGSAIAIGAHARASGATPGEAPGCAKCPYKKKFKQFAKLVQG